MTAGDIHVKAETGDFVAECAGVALVQGAEDARVSKK